jgi:hypothetical protein
MKIWMMMLAKLPKARTLRRIDHVYPHLRRNNRKRFQRKELRRNSTHQKGNEKKMY